MENSQLLKKIISLSLLFLTCASWILFQDCNADASWTSFALCTSCTNTRLVVPGNLFEQRLIPKGSSLIWARIDCSGSCVNQDSCYAFNFYENENFYICELLSDNFRRNKTILQQIAQPGCSVWEKLITDPKSVTTVVRTEPTSEASTPMTDSSTRTSTKPSTVTTQSSTMTSSKASTQKTAPSTKITTRPSTRKAVATTTTNATLCADVRPGCLGTMPNCYSCIKTCVDFMARDDLLDPQVSLWPDGDGPDSIPINAECEMENLILSERVIDLDKNSEDKNYLLSFNDMRRLIQLNVYPYLRFQFRIRNVITTVSKSEVSIYANASISSDGTLSNLIYTVSNISTADIFDLKGLPMKPTPFVNVTDDRYGCGSFWLLDDANATYCPGGRVGMFGTFRVNGTQIVNTGIRVPTQHTGVTYYSQIALITGV